MRTLLVASLVAVPLAASAAPRRDVTITRDDWGIAHVHGKTDADAVFGMIYAQAEDGFERIERNYLVALGRLAEAEGEKAVWEDLRARLFVDEADLKATYKASPPWLRALMDAWAEGLNHFLATHPNVKPRVLTRFEPWMALSFTEGSIGGDIERISLPELQAFYGGTAAGAKASNPAAPRSTGPAAAPKSSDRTAAPKSSDPAATKSSDPGGSNGIALAPSRSESGHALLLINPHTSFYFRSEQQVQSDEGLDVYGAATWGQFFIYQGFNAHCGWMHTSSGVDVVDEFRETVTEQGGKPVYRYGAEQRPVQERRITVAVKGSSPRAFTTYRTHHGPIVRALDGQWVSFAMMYKPIEALTQSFQRTKARGLQDFIAVAEAQKANSSNDTIFADSEGHIAYLHPQFIPRRDDRFDYTQPVDGADPATDWGPLLPGSDTPRAIDSKSGYAVNNNDWPYSAAGPDSPRRDAFPKYMDMAGPNARGAHARLLLQDTGKFTLESLQHAAFDSYLPGFAHLIPMLVSAWEWLPGADPRKAELAQAIATLRAWDFRWSEKSEATTLAVLWGEELRKTAHRELAEREFLSVDELEVLALRTSPEQKVAALRATLSQLTHDFGRTLVPWGDVNRFQRAEPFDDAQPSEPVPFVSGRWGSLASFGVVRGPGPTKKLYGVNGNSFVAVVEFGPKVRARAVSAGGASGDPKSPHHRDQIDRYRRGDLREVYLTPEQLKGHIERAYRP